MEKMITVEGMQEIAFRMIATIGEAKTKYILALRETKNGNDKELVNELLDEAAELTTKAHKEHYEVIQLEANGNSLPFSIMLMHAEDQLLTTETIKMLVNELIELYSRID